MTEQRARIGTVRAAEVDGEPGVTLHAVTPGVVDDYGSLWTPDVFDRSLGQRMPTLCWAHDWSEPLGPPTGFRTGPNGPEIDFRFSDFDAVPTARRDHAQISDGTIVDCSVGFSRVNGGTRAPTSEERDSHPGIREIISEAGLEEVSLVLRGAVPGAKVLQVRSAAGVLGVDEEFVITLARKVAAGDMSKDEADTALLLAAGQQPEPLDLGGIEPTPTAEVTEAAELLESYIDGDGL